MYYEFYIDVFFLENMILNYVVLLLVGLTLKKKISPGRIFLSSFIGAIGACILMMCPVKNMLVTFALGYGLTGIWMVKIGYGITQRRMLAKGVLLLYGITFLLGGIFQALTSQITLPVILSGILSAFILTLLLKGYQSLKYKTQNMYEVTVALNGKTLCVRGLRDTGNQLKEPVTGKPVSILEYTAAKELLDENAKMFYIPYHSIGKSSGLLPGVALDYMSIKREHGSQKLERPIIAVSKEPVNKEGNYQMILHPRMVDD